MPKLIEKLEEKILTAARKRLTEDSLSGFSLRAVAADCGIAVGTVYNYYKDKEALMAAAMASDWAMELKQVRTSIMEVGSFQEGVLCIYREICCFSDTYEHIWQSYKPNAGFATLYHRRHMMLVDQIHSEIDFLAERFPAEISGPARTLLAELIIAASRHREVGEEDILRFVSDF